MRLIKTSFALVALLSFGVIAAGCNTTEGFGRDMESSGRAIKNEAREHNH